MKRQGTRPTPSVDWQAEAERLEGVYFNRGGRYGNDAAACATALFELVRLYATRDEPIPAWIGRVLLAGYDKYQEGREPSLSAALGVKRPSKAIREARRIDPHTGLSVAASIVLEVRDRNDILGKPIDKGLFDVVGQSLSGPLLASKVERIYYAYRANAEVLAEVAEFVNQLRRSVAADLVATAPRSAKRKGRRQS